MAKLYGIKDAADLLIRDAVTLQPIAFIDYANKFEVDLKGDLVYALAKGVKRIGFKKPTEGGLKIEADLTDMRTLALFLGTTVKEEKGDFNVRESADVANGKITLTDTPDEKSLVVFAQDGERELIKPTSVSGKDVTLDTKYNGRSVMAFYIKKGVNLSRFTVNANDLPRTYIIDAYSTVGLDKGGVSLINMHFYKAVSKSNEKFTFDATKPSKFNFDLALLGNAKNDIFTYTEVVEDGVASASVGLSDLQGHTESH